MYNYIGHEDEVMAFCYTANIGQIDKFNNISIYYNNVLLPFVDNIKDFETIPSNVFYEEGKLYLKIEDHIEGIDSFDFYIDDQKTSYNLELIHIWNIFDEFATFVNTRRQENETNKQLFDRILYITKNLPNGTDSGLKHAIISELITDFPDITEDEIVIEQPTPENLMKPYEDYETLLDMLATINRDVYRTKKWDLDYWEYNFESISYIPHIWNKSIQDWQNGVGSYNDLEVILADDDLTTDATIYFYKKSLEEFQKYIYNKNIDTDIHFTMTKYNNILNKKNVKYKITASELENITDKDIKMHLYESKKQTTRIPIQDIAVDWGKDLEIIDNTKLSDIYDYKLEFISSTGYDLKISKAKVIYIDKNTGEEKEFLDLVKPQQGFIFNSEQELVSGSTKVMVDAIEHFTTSSDLCNEDDYITIQPGKNAGKATLSLSDKAGMYVNIEHSCDMVSYPQHEIKTAGGYWTIENNTEVFVVRGDYSTEEKIVNLSMNVNKFSFVINETNANSRIILELIDGNNPIETIDLSDKSYFSIKETDMPRDINIKIKVLSINDVKFSNFLYNNYHIELKTKYGELIKTTKGYKLPNFYTNELQLVLEAKSGISPILKCLYVGEDFEHINYRTELIPYIDNCDRLLEIVTTGSINLIKIEKNNEIEIINDFRPLISYKALSDQAYLRIDLSSYESIDMIDANPASIEEIEESGVIYYNLRLKSLGVIVTDITVTGVKHREAREVLLEDMVKFYIPDFNPTYDKIYCSKCSKGLIISRLNPGGTPYNEQVRISSEIFTGIRIAKYEMKMPNEYGAIYGSNNGHENRSNISINSFDYINIYPAGSQIYQAINEFDTYLTDNKFIPIANNFSPSLDMNKLLFYNIDVLDDTERDNIFVRFHSAQNSGDNIIDMDNWSMGTSNSYVAIKNNSDLANNTMYDMTTYNVDEKGFLSSSIDIKDSYELTNHTILNTEKYILSTDNDDITIKYDYYDGTSKKAHLLKFEEIIVESDGFNKLNFSNIDSVFHCSTYNTQSDFSLDIEFEILKEQGIIIWKNPSSLVGKKIYLAYSIKKPIAFLFSLDYLYKAIEFDVDAYAILGEYSKENLKNEDQLDLYDLKDKSGNEIDFYKDSDLVYVSCSSPAFEAKLKNDKVIFEKYLNEETILIKTGYYYINGREYYLFSEEGNDAIKNNEFYTTNNVDISGGEMTTYKKTDNYIANSEFRCKGLSDLYHFNCKKPLTYGVSNFNYLTACNTFDLWNTFEMKLKLSRGLNGLALEFVPQIECGYAFIDITDGLIDNTKNYISFYATKDIFTYIGKESDYLDMNNYKRSLNINIHKDVIYENSDIRYTYINKKPNERYYLIVQGAGIIDDIILSDSKESTFEAHKKNIDLLGFDLYEKKVEGSQFKLILKSDKDYTSNYASLMSDGYIKTTSSLDWYLTEYKSFKDDSDFKNCILNNIGVNKDSIFTNNKSGSIETLPFRIDNIDNIRKLIIKINDLNLDEMTGFKTTVMTAAAYNEKFVPCCSVQSNNIFCIPNSSLNNYMKFKIEIPPYKYIKNISIYAEYTSSDENPMPIVTKDSGHIISKIYDIQESVNCRVKSIDIEDISNINDIDIYIRSSIDSDMLNVWTDWKKVIINNDFKVQNNISFKNSRFLQYKIVIKRRDAYIKFKDILIEIK